MRRLFLLLLAVFSFNAVSETQAPEPQLYRVLDGGYTVCQTLPQYEQLMKWSLYGVGSPPQTGCFPAPVNAKAVIKQCPENDIIICQFEISPEDGRPTMQVWASKVMLKPVPAQPGN